MMYSEPAKFSKADVEYAILNDQIERLIEMTIAVSMYSEESLWAESVCFRLATHNDWNVRGNAILGFGHIARVHGKIERIEARQLINAALVDHEEYVRGQAESAADDVSHYLGWSLSNAT